MGFIEDKDVRYAPFRGEPRDFWGLVHETRYRWVAQSFAIAGKTIMDFGCGTGYGAYELAQTAGHVTGIDYSSVAIEYANKNYARDNLRFLVGDASSKKSPELFNGGTFDFVVSFDVIEHVERYFDYIENICAVLKENGVLIIGSPNRLQTFNWNVAWNKYHVQEFSPYQLRKLLGFYFKDVKLIAQDFGDDALKARTMKTHMSLSHEGRISCAVMKVMPRGIQWLIRNVLGTIDPRKRAQAHLCDEDIAFDWEPGEKRLDESLGLIAVCTK
jgi:SAM-dependent methyltransferase